MENKPLSSKRENKAWDWNGHLLQTTGFYHEEDVKEAYKVIMHDLECLTISDSKNNRYHYKLLVGNIKDLFGITDGRWNK